MFFFSFFPTYSNNNLPRVMTQTSHGDPALYPLYNPVISVNGAPPVVFLPILPFHPAPAPPPATPYLQPQSSPEAPLE